MSGIAPSAPVAPQMRKSPHVPIAPSRLNRKGRTIAPKESAISATQFFRGQATGGARVGRQEQSMRYGLLGSIAALAAGASLAFAQPPTRSTAPVVVPPIPTGSATTAYEPLATVPPPQPVDGSPALDMFGPDGPGDLGQSRRYNRGWVKG